MLENAQNNALRSMATLLAAIAQHDIETSARMPTAHDLDVLWALGGVVISLGDATLTVD